MSRVRVELPQHLRTLAGVNGREVTVDVAGVVSIRTVLDALETRHPMLKGTVRDHQTLERRAFLRFFACEEDWSHEPVDEALPDEVASGKEPLLIIGAIAGGTARSATRGFAAILERARVVAPVGRGN
jgi:hypothetical protein